MKRIAVTGSAGFIGARLITSLKARGFDVVEISRTGGYDITNFDSVKGIAKCDVVVHLAAKTFVPDSFKNPLEFYAFNLNATLNVLELAKVWNAKVIYVSSYVYGRPMYTPINEEHPLSFHNPYAQSKLLSEELCLGYHKFFGLSFDILRPFNIYGEGQDESFLIPEIIKKAKTGHVVLKDPRPKRDYVHVDDVVDAICSSAISNNTGYNIYNIGTGISYSVLSLVEIIKKSLNIDFVSEFTNEYRAEEVLESVADITRIKNELGWVPKVSLEDGLKEFGNN